MIRPAACITVLLLACSTTSAVARLAIGGDDCDVDIASSVKVEPARFVFTDDASQRVVEVLPGGAVSVDGAALQLSAADRARVDELERGMRALVPEVKAIAIDAVGIAFEAVGHASAAFASSPHQARESAQRIARTARELQEGIEKKQNWSSSSDADLDRLIEGAVGSLVGEMVGNVTGMALKVAFTGDETAIAELEARAAAIDRTVEEAVEKSSSELERRAEALCMRVRALDTIESRIEARLPGDKRFDLIRMQ
jgi:hypothetical protein